ncbi:unnamed protein product [Caenorhabditis brenneri]
MDSDSGPETAQTQFSVRPSPLQVFQELSEKMLTTIVACGQIVEIDETGDFWTNRERQKNDDCEKIFARGLQSQIQQRTGEINLIVYFVL